MILVLLLYLFYSHLESSESLSTLSNMSESETNTNYMANQSMAFNSIALFVESVTGTNTNLTRGLAYNVTKTSDNDTRKEEAQAINSSKEYLTFTPKRELPLAMIIAGPAAAVGIMLFLCVSYYWHTVQLDRQAKRLSITLFVTPDSKEKNGDPPTRTQKLVPSKSKHFREPEFNPVYSQRRKSTLSVPTLVPPTAAMGKRGSSWSALADQEIINLSAPRRHSTFIL